MDLHGVTSILRPRARTELAGLDGHDGLLAGGTSLMSEPNPSVRRLVDLTALDWPDLVVDDDGLEIAATCTIERLITGSYPAHWRAAPLFEQSAHTLLASYKIWHTATVGGNVCLGLPAGAMISMCSALDAELLVWHADGTDSMHSTAEIVIGNAQNSLSTGDVLRSIRFPATALTQRTALRKASYAHLGRSGAVVIARRTPSGVVVSVTAATRRPYVIEVASTDPTEVAHQVLSGIPPDAFHTDAHGTAPWRMSVTEYLVGDAVAEVVS